MWGGWFSAVQLWQRGVRHRTVQNWYLRGRTHPRGTRTIAADSAAAAFTCAQDAEAAVVVAHWSLARAGPALQPSVVAGAPVDGPVAQRHDAAIPAPAPARPAPSMPPTRKPALRIPPP